MFNTSARVPAPESVSLPRYLAEAAGPQRACIANSTENLHIAISQLEQVFVSLNERLNSVTANFPRPCNPNDANGECAEKPTCSAVRDQIDVAIARVNAMCVAVQDLEARIDL